MVRRREERSLCTFGLFSFLELQTELVVQGRDQASSYPHGELFLETKRAKDTERIRFWESSFSGPPLSGAHLPAILRRWLWGEGALGCSAVSECEGPEFLLGAVFGAVVRVQAGAPTSHVGVWVLSPGSASASSFLLMTTL